MSFYLKLAKKVAFSELEIQRFFYSKSNLDIQECYFFPGLYKLKSSRYFYLYRLFSRFAFLLRPIALTCIYFALSIRLVILKGHLGTISLSTYKTCDLGDVLFASSELGLTLSRKANIPVQLVITLPRGGRLNTSQEQVQANGLALLNWREFVQIAFIAWVESMRLALDHSTKHVSMMSVYLLEVFVVSEALRKVHRLTSARSLFVTDHFDRWAVMSDLVRESGCYQKLGVIQHGILTTASVSNFTILIPEKLYYVDELYYYHRISLDVFKSKILGTDTVRCYEFSNDLELCNIPYLGFGVLIVGHPLCFDFHCMLASKIFIADKTVSVFYKPHPTMSEFGASANMRWNLIDNPEMFPDVDLVVSYPSSLAVQYEEIATPVVFHKLEASSEDADPVLVEVITKIRSLT